MMMESDRSIDLASKLRESKICKVKRRRTYTRYAESRMQRSNGKKDGRLYTFDAV